MIGTMFVVRGSTGHTDCRSMCTCIPRGSAAMQLTLTIQYRLGTLEIASYVNNYMY